MLHVSVLITCVVVTPSGVWPEAATGGAGMPGLRSGRQGGGQVVATRGSVGFRGGQRAPRDEGSAGGGGPEPPVGVGATGRHLDAGGAASGGPAHGGRVGGL